MSKAQVAKHRFNTDSVSMTLARCVLRACKTWEKTRDPLASEGRDVKSWEDHVKAEMRLASMDLGLLRVVNLATHWSNDLVYWAQSMVLWNGYETDEEQCYGYPDDQGEARLADMRTAYRALLNVKSGIKGELAWETHEFFNEKLDWSKQRSFTTIMGLLNMSRTDVNQAVELSSENGFFRARPEVKDAVLKATHPDVKERYRHDEPKVEEATEVVVQPDNKHASDTLSSVAGAEGDQFEQM